MKKPHRDVIAELAAANPIPDPSLDPTAQEHADAVLRRVLSQPTAAATPAPDTGTAGPASDAAVRRSRRRSYGFEAVAAAALLFVAGGATWGVVERAPLANATEVLEQAGEAAGALPEPGLLEQAYMQRVDTIRVGERNQSAEEAARDLQASRDLDGLADVQDTRPTLTKTTDYAVFAGQVTSREFYHGPEAEQSATLRKAGQEGADGIVTQKLADAQTGEELARLAQDIYGDAVRGQVELLLHPALTPRQHKAIFENLAGEGFRMIGTKDHPILTGHGLVLHLVPKSGQLKRVDNLVAPDSVTEIQAAAVLGCVAPVGFTGPEEISLACADNNYVLTDIRWDNWGADLATAHATAYVNECDPSCAEGEFLALPVTVRVGEKEECGFNARVYSRLDVEYAPEYADRNDTFDIGCATSADK